MRNHPQIIIQNLSYATNEKQIFQDLSLTLQLQKIAIVGRNGIGKSTLLKLLRSELPVNSGAIKIKGEVAYCPQNYSPFLEASIAELFAVDEQIQALERILNGSTDLGDYDMLKDEWDIREKTLAQLALFGLDKIDLNRKLKSFSGGQQTQIMLANVFNAKADFILLDEPTNNLDIHARNKLYDFIRSWQGGLIIISHDRRLLNLMDEIIAMDSLGVKCYGGNYDFYEAQKNLETEAAELTLKARMQLLNKAKRQVQTRSERHQQAQSKGQRAKKAEIVAKGSYDKIAFKSAQGRSEKTNRRIRLQADRKLKTVNDELKEAKSQLEKIKKLNIRLPQTFVAANKIVLDIEALSFKYPQQEYSIIANFNLKIIGPERVAISGQNGSGKTTLIQLILGNLNQQGGIITKGIKEICYLDQQIALLNPDLTIIENFRHFNPDIEETKARFYLADFLFRNETANKLVKNLSGGEILRATLACVLMAKTPPQLLILDEPTNHLDLESIQHIEMALETYQGALIVISHDESFLENIGVSRFILAPFVFSDKVLF